MFTLRNSLRFTRGAILIFITILQALRISDGFQWTEKEVNQSVAVRKSITLSWKLTFTAEESSQARSVALTRYPQNNSSALVQIGVVGFVNFPGVAGLSPFRLTPLAPRVAIPQSASVTEPAITIQDVTKQDEGFYRITVTVGTSPVANHTIFLTVFVPAKVLFITRNNSYVGGSRVELVCSVEGDPPPYVAWINVTDGSVLQNRTINTNYVIQNVSSRHKGTYRCVTGNIHAIDSNETTIIDVFFGPTITNIIGESRPVCEGEQVVLTCEAEGNPQPYLAWKRNGIVKQNSTNTTYTISSVKREDEGSYRCEATNIVDKTSSITSIADVQFPAKVLIITPDDSYVMNTSVELVCSVEGDPPPYVAWINVTDGSVLQNRTVNTNYVIPSVSSINKGTYRCVTGNICGNDRNETTITDVLIVPTITSVTDESRPVCEGEQVVLTCKAEGNPKPYLVWKRKGIVLQNSTNTNYTISNIKREDEGNYTCVATNIVDSKSEVANIADVQFPAKVLFITPNDSYAMNTSVELVCSVEGDPPPYVAWINVTDGSLLQNRTVNTNYVISSVSTLHKGTYRCETGNRCGPMDSNETTITDVLDRVWKVELSIRFKNSVQAKRKRRSTQKTENVTTVTLKIENFFKTEYGRNFLWIRIISTLKEAETTKIVFEAVFRPNAKYTQTEVLDALEKAGPGVLGFSFALADPCDPNICPSDEPVCTGTPGTELKSCSAKSVVPKADNTTLITVLVVVAVVLVTVIVTAVVCKIKKKRCRKDHRVANGEEHKLDERHMSDPAVEAQAGGYSNAALDHYVNDGPTANKNKNAGKKPEDLYAKVDMSKKCKKKKPGEILYADLADFPQTQAAAKSANTGQQPIRNPQSTDYASITDIMQEREGGSFKKVPINTSAADLNPLQRPMDEKPVKDDACTKETNNTETGDETDNLLARKGDGGVDSKL